MFTNPCKHNIKTHPRHTLTARATTATTATAAEEFLAKARPVIQRAQGLNIPFGKPLTPTYMDRPWRDEVSWRGPNIAKFQTPIPS